MPLVSQGNINHSHQSLLQKGAVILPIVLLEHLTGTMGTHWENQTPPRLQLLQELEQKIQVVKKKKHIERYPL